MKFTVDLLDGKTKEIELDPKAVAGFGKDTDYVTKDGEKGVVVDLNPDIYDAVRVWIPESRIEEAKTLMGAEDGSTR